MASYTAAYMSPLISEKDSLESIGSVAANWSRSSEEEEREGFQEFCNGGVLASSILSELGPSAHDRFIKAATLVKAEEEAANIKRRERRRRGVAKLAKMGKKVKNCVGRMVPKRRTGVKALDDLMKHVRIESEGWLSVRSRTTSASSEPQVRFPID
ncbi:hypothetical protein MMC09_001472 [Bachmanniomyces sp. S44760]|nr:hypothetical protein [Bachmanniomyces sp. S44760]